MVKQQQLRTAPNEKMTRYHDVLSTARRLAFDSTRCEGRAKELVSKLQLRYGDRRRVPVLARPSSQVVEDDPRSRELKSLVAMKKIERVAAAATVASIRRE